MSHKSLIFDGEVEDGGPRSQVQLQLPLSC